MNEVLKKLGFRSQSPILVLNAPEEYNDILEGVEVEVHRDTKGKGKNRGK